MAKAKSHLKNSAYSDNAHSDRGIQKGFRGSERKRWQIREEDGKRMLIQGWLLALLLSASILISL